MLAKGPCRSATKQRARRKKRYLDVLDQVASQDFSTSFKKTSFEVKTVISDVPVLLLCSWT
jgi:hypothetical protein